MILVLFICGISIRLFSLAPSSFKSKILLLLNKERCQRVQGDIVPVGTYVNYKLWSEGRVEKYCQTCSNIKKTTQDGEVDVYSQDNMYPFFKRKENCRETFIYHHDHNIESSHFIGYLNQKYVLGKKDLIIFSTASATKISHPHAVQIENFPEEELKIVSMCNYQLVFDRNKKEEIDDLKTILDHIESLNASNKSPAYCIVIKEDKIYLSITNQTIPGVQVPFFGKNFGALELMGLWVIENQNIYEAWMNRDLPFEHKEKMVEIVEYFIMGPENEWESYLLNIKKMKQDYSHYLNQEYRPKSLQPHSDLDSLDRLLKSTFQYRTNAMLIKASVDGEIISLKKVSENKYQYIWASTGEVIEAMEEKTENFICSYSYLRSKRKGGISRFTPAYVRSEEGVHEFVPQKRNFHEVNTCAFNCREETSHFHPNGLRFFIEYPDMMPLRLTRNVFPFFNGRHYLIVPYFDQVTHVGQEFRGTLGKLIFKSHLRLIQDLKENAFYIYASKGYASCNHHHAHLLFDPPSTWLEIFNMRFFQFRIPKKDLFHFEKEIYQLLSQIESQKVLVSYCLAADLNFFYISISKPGHSDMILPRVGKGGGPLEIMGVMMIENEELMKKVSADKEWAENMIQEALSASLMTINDWKMFWNNQCLKKYMEPLSCVVNPYIRFSPIEHTPADSHSKTKEERENGRFEQMYSSKAEEMLENLSVMSGLVPHWSNNAKVIKSYCGEILSRGEELPLKLKNELDRVCKQEVNQIVKNSKVIYADIDGTLISEEKDENILTESIINTIIECLFQQRYFIFVTGNTFDVQYERVLKPILEVCQKKGKKALKAFEKYCYFIGLAGGVGVRWDNNSQQFVSWEKYKKDLPQFNDNHLDRMYELLKSLKSKQFGLNAEEWEVYQSMIQKISQKNQWELDIFCEKKELIFVESVGLEYPFLNQKRGVPYCSMRRDLSGGVHQMNMRLMPGIRLLQLEELSHQEKRILLKVRSYIVEEMNQILSLEPSFKGFEARSAGAFSIDLEFIQKGEALLKVSQILSVPLEDSVYFGDHCYHPKGLGGDCSSIPLKGLQVVSVDAVGSEKLYQDHPWEGLQIKAEERARIWTVGLNSLKTETHLETHKILNACFSSQLLSAEEISEIQIETNMNSYLKSDLKQGLSYLTHSKNTSLVTQSA